MFHVSVLLAFIVFAFYVIGTKPRVKRSAGHKTVPFDDLFRGRGQTRVTPIDKGQMLRCHNCGCFFPESRVVTRVIEGHVIEFCSRNCRENFRYP